MKKGETSRYSQQEHRLEKKGGKTRILFTCLALISLFYINASLAGNLKGNLNNKELDFFYHTAIPILVKSGICTRVTGDCQRGNYFICSSHQSLTCEVYGITNEKVIKQLFLAFLVSELQISSLKFWRSNYHETSIFEKPLLEYIDRTWSK